MHVFPSKKYKKSLKKVLQGGKVKMVEIDTVVDLLSEKNILSIKYRDHALAGDYIGCRECHIRPNILLLYQILDKEPVLILIDIGSHPKFF